MALGHLVKQGHYPHPHPQKLESWGKSVPTLKEVGLSGSLRDTLEVPSLPSALAACSYSLANTLPSSTHLRCQCLKVESRVLIDPLDLTFPTVNDSIPRGTGSLSVHCQL